MSSQPAVSLHVRELENELEAILFDRSGSGINLTLAGETLYELSKPLVKGMDELSVNLIERIDDNVSGRLHVAASVAGASFVLPPYVKQFRARYPAIRLRVRNCLLSEGVKLLLDDEVELVLGVKDPYPEDTLEYRNLLPYDIVLITSLDHPLAGRTTVSPEEASAWPAIVPPAGTYSRQFGETAAQTFGIDINAVIEVGGWSVIKRYVERGLGISVVPSISITETDRLSIIPLKEYFPSRNFGVFTRRGKFLTPPLGDSSVSWSPISPIRRPRLLREADRLTDRAAGGALVAFHAGRTSPEVPAERTDFLLHVRSIPRGQPAGCPTGAPRMCYKPALRHRW